MLLRKNTKNHKFCNINLCIINDLNYTGVASEACEII